jgi:crossover junction endodeoxyribonuclease RuvC
LGTMGRRRAKEGREKMNGVYRWIGIDPGKHGGIALLESGHASAWPMPETGADIRDLLEEFAEGSFATIERVHSMPRQGVTSMFTFGKGTGILLGILWGLRIPFAEVTPQRWQKTMNCQTRGDKNVSKARAQALFPELKITHATADALLIATYGQHTGAMV